MLVRAAAEARTALREAASAAAEAAERARSVAAELDEALAALKALEAGPALIPPPRRASPFGDARLSPREQEVLALVAEGRSNKAIAEALFVSPNTVKTHVASLLAKLHADTRVQLAAIAAQQRLL
jgi:DNA-binding NarL/FixJ family response regulator